MVVNKSGFKIASLFVAAIASAIVLSLTFSVGTAHASDASLKALKSGTVKLSYVSGKARLNTVSFWGDAGQKVTKVKSSKKAVATATRKKAAGVDTVSVKLKKAGTTRISFYVGKKKYSATVKVYKYEAPIESLTIGSKDCTDSLKPKNMTRAVGGPYTFSAFTGGSSKKVSVKAADGWKISKIYTVKYKPVKGIYKPFTTKYKNGKKIKGDFTIDMKNKKTGLVESFFVSTF